MESDIWYVKFLGGYVPCNWKGFVFQFGIAFFALAEFVLLGFIGDRIGVDLTIISIALVFGLAIYNIVMINRHS